MPFSGVYRKRIFTVMSKNVKSTRKEKKPPLPQKAKWEIAIAVILIIVLLAGIAFSVLYVSFGFFQKPTEKQGENISFGKTSQPEFSEPAYSGAISAFASPNSLPANTAQTKEERIALAARMYEVANANTQHLNGWALSIKYSTCINIGSFLSIPVVGLRYQLKNGNEYYATEYALPDGDAAGTLAGWFAKESSMFASRSYVDVTKTDYMYSEKCYSPTIEINSETKEVKVTSNYSPDNMVPEEKWAKKQPVPTFSAEQDKPYWVANRPMTATNILDATIEYVETPEGNYYSIVIELDVTKPETYENTIGELRAGAGDDAKYDKMTETLEIWENGYYKRFHSLDYCSASGGIMKFDFDFDTSFFYGESSLKPENYDNFIEVKQIAEAFAATQQ